MEGQEESVRQWNWDFDEMKKAGAMDSQEAVQEIQCPIISGFTPVNPSRPKGGTSHANNEHEASAAMPSALPKAPKARKTRPSPTPKPSKVAATKKLRRGKKAQELQSRDISKDLCRTKPAASGGNAALAKTATPSELVLSESMRDTDITRDAVVQFQESEDVMPDHVQQRPLGLADQYQTAYTNEEFDADFPKTSKAGKVLDLGLVCGTLHAAADMPWVVPSAQRSKHASGHNQECLRQGLGRNTATCEDALYSDETFRDDEQAEELTIYKKSLAEAVRSVTPIKEHDDAPLLNWQPQDFTGDPSMFEKSEGHVLAHKTMQASPYDDSVVSDAILQKQWDNDHCFDDDDLEKNLMVTLDDRSDYEPLHPGYEDDCATVLASRDSIDEEMYYDSFAVRDAPNLDSSYSSIDQPSRHLVQASEQAVETRAAPVRRQGLGEGDDCFDDDELEEGLMNMTAGRSDIVLPQTSLTASKVPPPLPKLQWMSPKSYTPTRFAQLRCFSASNPNEYLVNEDMEHPPFIRPPFPTPIRDRSPILGLTNHIVLRTCFRIGEALNAAAVASRANTDAIIELYARIVLSEREVNGGFKQFFQFGDLFTDKVSVSPVLGLEFEARLGSSLVLHGDLTSDIIVAALSEWYI